MFEDIAVNGKSFIYPQIFQWTVLYIHKYSSEQFNMDVNGCIYPEMVEHSRKQLKILIYKRKGH